MPALPRGRPRSLGRHRKPLANETNKLGDVTGLASTQAELPPNHYLAPPVLAPFQTHDSGTRKSQPTIKFARPPASCCGQELSGMIKRMHARARAYYIYVSSDR